MAIKKTKNRDASKRDLEEHIVAEAVLSEKAADTSGISGLDSVSDLQWKATQGEVHSDTKLEDDHGTGQKVVLRSFDFSANPAAFKERTPSKQELFNAHAKQIEYFLYQDGLIQMPEVNPRLILSKNRKHYRIIVAASARFGQHFNDTARTLTELTHGPNPTR